MKWRFYDLMTGIFLPASMLADAETAAANTPPGCGAMLAVIDPLAQRVDLVALAARQKAIDAAQADVDAARSSLPPAPAKPGDALPPVAPGAAKDLAAALAALAAAQALPVLASYTPPAPSAASVMAADIAAGEAAAQALLDSTANAWGYDSLLSASSYVTSAVPQFRAEAVVLVAWRDALWQASYAVEADVKAGKRPMPSSTAEFTALLPPAPARPA